jgi:hypothetical protein
MITIEQNTKNTCLITIEQNTNNTCQGMVMPAGRSPSITGRLSLNGFILCSSILVMASNTKVRYQANSARQDHSL